MLIDNNLFEDLTIKAKESPRLRYSYDLRNSDEDNSQRMLIALEPGTVLEIHKHPTSSTTIVVLRGSIKHNIYDDAGMLKESIILRADAKELPIYEIPRNIWHNLECLETGTVIFESKYVKYIPETDAEFFITK